MKKHLFVLSLLILIVSGIFLTGCSEPCDHVESEWITETESTCSVAGQQVKRCQLCDIAIEYNTIPKLAHTEGEWITESEAACGIEGKRVKHCQVCDIEVRHESILELKHVKGEWVTEEEASCNSWGQKFKSCQLCNKVLETNSFGELKHIEGEWETVQQPTCMSTGGRLKQCSLCTATLGYETIPKLSDHVYEWETYREPTCAWEGSRTKACIYCSRIIDFDFPAHLGGHKDSDEDSHCDTCDDELFKINVHVLAEGNASATVDDYFLLSIENCGIINIELGPNSIYKGHERFFLPLEDDPPFIGGHYVLSQLNFLEWRLIDTLTSTYQCRINYSSTFGMPQDVYLWIADTTETAVVITKRICIDDIEGHNIDNGIQAFLYWGKLVDNEDEEAANDPENYTHVKKFSFNDSHKFLYFSDLEGNIVTDLEAFDMLMHIDRLVLYEVYGHF